MTERAYFIILKTILRVFFRLLYVEFAWTYDWVAATVSAGHWSEWVDQAVPFIQGKRVLELGFGPGHLQEKLRDQGINIFGLDHSRPMCLQAARRMRKKHRSNENVYAQSPKLVQGVGNILPFRRGSFQTILATFPTEYIFLPATAAEIERTLSPGGRLVIVLTAWITGKSLRERLSSFLFRATGQSEPWDIHWHTPFSDCGMRVETKWIDLGHSRVCVLIAEKNGLNEEF